MRPRLHERGTVPCRDCGRPHNYVDDTKRPGYRTWASPDDGHAYCKMSAEEVVALVARMLGAEIVHRHAEDLRRLADS